MMIYLFPFLAARDDDNTAKIIFGVIFAAIWAISSLASTVHKKKEEERRRRVRAELERLGGVPPVPSAPPQRPRVRPMDEVTTIRRPIPTPPPRPNRPAAKVNRPPTAPPQATRPKPARRPTRADQLPAMLESMVRPPASARHVEHEEQDASPRAPLAPAPEPAPAHRSPVGTGPSANAALLGRWLNPGTLRSQFILTEVFQPPVALRPERF